MLQKIPKNEINFFDRMSFNALLGLDHLLGKEKVDSFLAHKKNRLKENIHASLSKKKLRGNVHSIDQLENLSPIDFKRKYFNRGLPVIFKGAAKNWDCCKNWNFEFFKKNYGNEKTISVEVEGFTGHNVNKEFEIIKLHQLIENIESGGSKYLRFSPLLDNHPELTDQLNNSWFDSMKPRMSFSKVHQLFIGGPNSATHLHCAQPCNFFVQVTGRKKWKLIPNQYNSVVEPIAKRMAHFGSAIDHQNPNLQKHPTYPLLDSYEATLESGDILFNPSFMWHFVQNESNSIGFGYRFSSIRSALKASPSLFLLRLLATNPPIWKTMRYGAQDTNLIWAHSNGNIKDVLAALKKYQ